MRAGDGYISLGTQSQLCQAIKGECEYWLTVPPECKDRVLLNLIRERFACDAEKPLDVLFREWLEERNIPHKCFS